MPDAFAQLSPKQEDAILALLHEPTLGKAAESVGVDEKTLWRWLKDAGFNKAYREARRETFRQAISLTQRYAPFAVQALLKIVSDQKTPPSARVAAAGLLLKFSRESIELDDLAARVEALEQTTAPVGNLSPSSPRAHAA